MQKWELMEPIKRLFKELGTEVYKLIILESLLNTAIFFFAIQLVFAFFELSVVFPLILAIIFLAWNISHYIKHFQLKAIEDKNPEVREILRTARDNMNDEHLLTLALFNELIEKIKTVSVGNLISQKKVMIKIGAVGILAFFSIYFTTSGLWDISFEAFEFNRFRLQPVAVPSIRLNETNDIYGDIKIAKLGNELLTIQINPTLSDIDFSKVSEPEKRDLNLNSFPVEIGAQAEKVSSEDKPKEFKLAREYNLKLHELGE